MSGEDHFWSCLHIDLGCNTGELADHGRGISTVQREKNCLGLESCMPGCLVLIPIARVTSQQSLNLYWLHVL